MKLDRLFDVRPAERPSVSAGFGALLLIVIAHTVLETVRDALFLRYVGPSGLGPMYILAAVVTLGVGSIASGIGVRFGAKRALIVTQVASSVVAAFFFFLPPTRTTLIGLYAFGAVAGSLLVPQLWTFVGTLFHAGQSRRVFGTIALAGVLGAVLGTGTAAAALLVVDVKTLLLGSSAAFLGSAVMIGTSPRAALPRIVPLTGEATSPGTPAATPARRKHLLTLFREEPLVPRLALVAILGSFTTLLVDYMFKSAVTRAVDPQYLGSFFARYYTVMNVLALLAQLFVAQRALARTGVLGTAAALPSFLWLGGVLSVLTGGSLLAVMGTKVADAALRHSVHRTGTELVYLALPPGARSRAKPFIDGAVVRVSQAIAAGALVLLAMIGWDSVPRIALLAAVSAFAWGVATYALRGPYLALFRRTLFGGGADRDALELDMASVELLVETLSSPRPHDVVAAMNALEHRAGSRLLPALVLLYDDADILVRALDIFGKSTRKDWVHLAERHVKDGREPVRRAALRALARARVQASGDRTSIQSAEELAEERPWIRGYLAVSAGDEAGLRDLAALLQTGGDDAAEARSGALVALGDQPTAGAGDVLVSILATMPADLSRQTIELTARTAAQVGDPRAVPWLVAHLEHTDGREAVRQALPTLGDPAFDALVATLHDPATPRRMRAQIPLALGGFDRQPAADLLFEIVQGDRDGLVRYKALRGLGQVIARAGLSLPATKLRLLTRRELVEHFRLFALEHATSGLRERPLATDAETGAGKILRLLLIEKRDQALERVFRLIKIRFPDEDVHGLHTAILSDDATDRATALEFLDALLAPRRRQAPNEDARPLLRLVGSDLPPAEVIARAAASAGFVVPTPATVLATLQAERDETLGAFAAATARAILPQETADATDAIGVTSALFDETSEPEGARG